MFHHLRWESFPTHSYHSATLSCISDAQINSEFWRSIILPKPNNPESYILIIINLLVMAPFFESAPRCFSFIEIDRFRVFMRRSSEYPDMICIGDSFVAYVRHFKYLEAFTTISLFIARLCSLCPWCCQESHDAFILNRCHRLHEHRISPV